MRSLQSTCVLLLLLCILPMFLGRLIATARPAEESGTSESDCVGCGDECNNCTYGSYFREQCGRRVCQSGPGESCGGARDKYGRCGDGMFCSCHKCSGCSADTFECFPAEFCPIYEPRFR